MDIVSDWIRHNFPHLPGGGYTLVVMVVSMIGLWMLYRRTGWGGWMAWFIAFGLYCIPVLMEFHH